MEDNTLHKLFYKVERQRMSPLSYGFLVSIPAMAANSWPASFAQDHVERWGFSVGGALGVQFLKRHAFWMDPRTAHLLLSFLPFVPACSARQMFGQSLVHLYNANWLKMFSSGLA